MRVALFHNVPARRAQHHQQQKKKLRFVINRLGRRAVSLAFESWVQQWEWQRWRLVTLSATLRRLSNRLVSAAYNAWVRLVRTRRSLRHVVEIMKIRQKDRLLLRAFRHYRGIVFRAVTTRKQDEAYLAQHATALVMANRRLARRRMLRTVVGAWATATANRHRRTKLAHRVVKTMLRRALSAAFMAWVSFAFTDPRDLKIERLQETIALLYSRGWRRACCTNVFKTWLIFVEERWEQRHSVKQNLDNLALELAIQNETERVGPGRRVTTLRY